MITGDNPNYNFIAGREVFLHYNYGKKGNLQRYGQVEPLPYDLSQVTSPVYIYYSDNDPISTAQVLHLIRVPYFWAFLKKNFTWPWSFIDIDIKFLWR